MIAVADSSPLIALSTIGFHSLLPDLYGNVLAPPAVWEELSAHPHDPFREELLGSAWLKQQEPANRNLILSLRQALGAGEAEAIALALETQAPVLLMDDRLARRTAAHLGLLPLGTVGILVQAKSKGLVQAIGPLIEEMQQRVGFRLSQQLIRRALLDVGEIDA